MRAQGHAHNSSWEWELALGVFMVMFGLVTATGAVSLRVTTPGYPGPTQVAGLAYSGWVFLLSMAISGFGALAVFLAGRDRWRPQVTE